MIIQHLSSTMITWYTYGVKVTWKWGQITKSIYILKISTNKVSLMINFILYIDNQIDEDEPDFLMPWTGKELWENSLDAIYLQRWKLDKKCILFRLSNKIFQANFLDGSQLFVNSESPIALFKSSDNKIVVKNIATETHLNLSYPSFHRRIEYLHNIIVKI